MTKKSKSSTSFVLPEFKNKQLLDQALTHKSYAHSHNQKDNERLEFLGDSVLGQIVTKLLYKLFPQKQPGELTELRSRVVNNNQLAKWAITLKLDKLIKLGKGAKMLGLDKNIKVLADTFEAIIGAFFEDANFNQVEKWLKPFILSVLK